MKSRGQQVVNKVSPEAVRASKMDVDLEEALDLAGAGKYQLFHCTMMLASLTAAVLEMIGNAFILPAAACDLDLPDSLKGIITSVPNIGVILTAPLWGRVADSHGRRPILQISCAVSGAVGLAAAFMPGLLSYALCKLVGSLFLACPSSLGWAYAGELMPRKRRDIAVLVLNGFLMISTVLSPALAWAILSHEGSFHLGTAILRPWRLLTAVYATPLLLTSIWLTQAKESPKFLVAKGHMDKALEVLRHIYWRNNGLAPESFGVVSLKTSSEGPIPIREHNGSSVELTQPRSQSALALLRPPHLKWLSLTGFLMFGIFSLLNGLFLFAADTINKVMITNNSEEGTLCILMHQNQSLPINQTSLTTCVDTISPDTFLIMVVTTLVYGMAVLLLSVCPVTKKTLLFVTFSVNGVACLMSGLLTNRMIAGAAMSALQLTAAGVGPLTAYVVHLFPTTLRGTAVGAVLMCGRLGSVVGANAAGYLLAVSCSDTFYGFTVLLFLCAALSFLLPKEHASLNSNSR